MAKAPKTKQETKPISEPRGAALKIGIVPFYNESTPVKHNIAATDAELKEISGSDFSTRVAQSAADVEGYTLILFSHGSNLHYLEPAIKNIRSAGNAADVILFISSDKNQVRTELISGFKTSELLAPAVLVKNEILQHSAVASVDVTDKGEFLYGLEKLANSWENVVTDHVDKVYKPAATMGNRLKWSLNWYKPGNGFGKPWKFIYLLVSVLMLAGMTFMSRDAAISGDEFTQFDWADTAIIPYYTDGKQAALSDPKKLMHLYGSSFDTFTALFARISGTENIYEMRHFWNAVFGFICMFFTSLIIKRLTGSYLYATLGLVLLFFTPRLLGDALNNPKDIPFAAGYLIAIYYSFKYYGQKGRKPLSHVIGIIAGVSLAISIRIGGLVLLPIIAFIAGMEYINQIGWKNFLAIKWKGFKNLLIGFVVISGASYFLGILFWPYGIEDPLTNPLAALKEFTNFGASLRQLFEGKLFDSDLLPRHYLIKYIIITMPAVSIIGLLLFAVLGLMKRKEIPAEVWYLVFAGVFPVVYIWIQKSNVYGGMRQVLFVIPCLVAVSVYGFYLVQKSLAKFSWSKYAVPVAALGLCTPAAVHVVKSHPMQYIYFNEFTGGVAGAYGNYEMDYYLASLKPSTEWFLNNVARKNPGKKYTVLTYGMDQVKYYCRKDTNVHVGFTRYDDRSEKNWDYAIFFNAYLDKERLLSGKYPPVGTVYTPEIDGKPMGLVLKRPGFEDYEGFVADRDKDYRKAITKYHEYLKKDPNSNEVYLYLAFAYANIGNLDSAIWAGNQSVKLYPEFTKSLFALNQFYTDKKDFDNAIKVMDQYLEARPKDGDAHLVKAQTLARKGNIQGAIQSVQNAIAVAPMDVRCYQFGAQLYQAAGDNMNAGLYNNASMLFQAKEASQYETALESLKGIYQTITGEELDMSKYK